MLNPWDYVRARNLLTRASHLPSIPSRLSPAGYSLYIKHRGERHYSHLSHSPVSPCGLRISPHVRCLDRRALATASDNDDGTTIVPAQPGTLPYHQALLVLHTASPSSVWPSHPLLHSLVVRDLSIKLKPHRVGVNISHYESAGIRGGDPLRDGFRDGFPFSAMLYRPGYPPELIEDIQSFGALQDVPPPKADAVLIERHLYVCTHGSRDCRCGTTGHAVFTILRSLVSSPKPGDSSPYFTVREISHIGGHKYAANVLDFPSGDVYGSVSTADSPMFFAALAESSEPLGMGRRSVEQERFLLKKWRGRLGMTEEQQITFHAERKQILDGLSSGGPEDLRGNEGHSTHRTAAVSLTFETQDGEVRAIMAREGHSLMQVAKANSIEGIEGTCGGNLEVGSCLPPVLDQISPSAVYQVCYMSSLR